MALSLQRKVRRKQVSVKRDKEMALIEHTLRYSSSAKTVVNFYGIGGIGKSTLKSQILDLVGQDYKKRTISIDFNNLNLLSQVELLLFIRNRFTADYSIPFYYFDVAYTIYLKKMGKTGGYDTSSLSKLEGISNISDLLSSALGIPLISLLPKLALEFEKRNIRLNYKEFEEQLTHLSTWDVEEIAETLAELLCHDLNLYQNENQETLIFIFDTYEKLWKNVTFGSQNSADRVVRELFQNLDATYWIILGREKLRWKHQSSYALYTSELQGFSTEETQQILQADGITDPDVVALLHKKTKGHPLSIEAVIKLLEAEYGQLSKVDLLEVESIKSLDTTIDRMVDHLSKDQQRTFQYLALTDGWDETLFFALLEQFRLHLNQDDLDELMEFAFIRKEDEFYYMHDVMRDHMLSESISRTKKERGYRFLLNYYQSQISEKALLSFPEKSIRNLEKAISYGFSLFDVMDEEREDFLTSFIAWFRESDRVSLEKYESHILIPLHEKFLQLLKTRDDFERATICEYDIAYIYLLKVRDYAVAESKFKRLLQDRRDRLGEEHKLTAKAYYGLAIYYTVIEKHDWAIDYHMKAYAIRKKLADEDPVALAISSSGLGFSWMEVKQWEKAKPFIQEAVELRQQLNDPSEKFNTLNSLLNYVYTLIQLDKPSEAERYCNEAIQLISRYDLLHTSHAIRAYRFRAILHSRLFAFQKAFEDLEHARVVINQTEKDSVNFESAKWLHTFGVLKWVEGDLEQAMRFLSESKEMKETLIECSKLPSHHWSYKETLEMIASLKKSEAIPVPLMYHR